MGKLLKISEAAEYLNVSQDTLRKWDKNNILKPLETAGGHRRYDTDILNDFIGKTNNEDIIDNCASIIKQSFKKAIKEVLEELLREEKNND